MKNNCQLKIAFICPFDSSTKLSWSGTPYYMAKYLQKHCGDVYPFQPLPINESKKKMLCNGIPFMFNNKRYDYSNSITLALEYAEAFEKRLKSQKFDLIYAPVASTQIALLQTSLPIIYHSDATYNYLCDYYPDFSNISEFSINEANILYGLTVKKANLLLYSSEWAAQSAIREYGADKSKVHVHPYGANLDYIPPKNIIKNRKKSEICKLLFVGIDWERKGGDIAIDTLVNLERLGLKAELTICGSTATKKNEYKNIKYLPYMNKDIQEDENTISNLYLNSDFLILPTRAECTAIVYNEAAAYGLPVITTNTGGVSCVVKNFVNGFTLPLDASGYDYANVIYSIFTNDYVYYRLVESSREMYDYTLNWDCFGKFVKKLIDEKL